MKISEILAKYETTLSLEVFPPKTDDKYSAVASAVNEIAALKPDFMSVTYGAGGGTSRFTTSIAFNIKQNCNVTPLAHLTCVSSDRAVVSARLDDLSAAGIENILALRGDIPKDASDPSAWSYHHANELVEQIAERREFCIGGACYPEGHPESRSVEEDILNLKRKVDAGCDFLTTQMFFDNERFYAFREKIAAAGINVPVIAGIMPIINAKQIKRSCELSGTTLPANFARIVERFGESPESMNEAGIAYCCSQIIDLIANGVRHIHVYTMNRPATAARIRRDLANILPVHER